MYTKGRVNRSLNGIMCVGYHRSLLQYYITTIIVLNFLEKHWTTKHNTYYGNTKKGKKKELNYESLQWLLRWILLYSAKLRCLQRETRDRPG